MSTIYRWSKGTPGVVPQADFDALRRAGEVAIADLANALNAEREAHASTRDQLEATRAREKRLERRIGELVARLFATSLQQAADAAAADRTDPDLVECAHCRRPVPYSEAEPVDGIDGPPALVCAACAARALPADEPEPEPEKVCRACDGNQLAPIRWGAGGPVVAWTPCPVCHAGLVAADYDPDRWPAQGRR
jgi:hypothetical protein